MKKINYPARAENLISVRSWLGFSLVAVLILGQTGLRAAVSFSAGESSYVVAAPRTPLEQRVIGRLTNYLEKVLGKPVHVVSQVNAVPEGKPAIILARNGEAQALGLAAPTNSPEAFALETRNVGDRAVVLMVAQTEHGLKRAMQRLVLKSEQRAPGLVIPDLQLSETPWIPQREWTLCGWVPDLVRGKFNNPHADKRLNVWLYGDQQVADYVEMYDWFGFSGTQLMDMVATYAALGSAEAYQSRLQTFARAARENGQNITLWVWAAQFTEYGWSDPTVTYTPAPGQTAFEDPKVRASFEKYYNRYAKLSPYVDRLITHFYDPGQLKEQADVFNYMRLLRDKFKAGNPNVQLGVDLWASESHSDYMQKLIDQGFGGSLVLADSIPHHYPDGKREALHATAKRHGMKMGVWGWYTAEMETDQLAAMYVNAQVLSEIYRGVKNGAHRVQPIEYWSEMEAYHLNNIFTMYAAGQLLWNPDRDPDEILREIAEGIWGPRNGPQIFSALKLIQDVRSGPSWETYWHTRPQHRVGTADAASDLSRAEACLAALEQMKTDPNFVPKFPLPFPPATFVELTLPHLRQIRAYSAFRLQTADIRAAAKKGTTKEELGRMLQAAWEPVPEYNTWIGTWGQKEARMQEFMINDLAQELGIAVKPPGWMRWRDAQRQLNGFQILQRASATPLQFKSDPTEPYRWPPHGGDERAVWREFHWTPAKGHDRLMLLLKHGAVQKTGEQTYQLTDWEEFSRK